MGTNRNWFKRLFTLDYEDSVNEILNLIEVHELWLEDSNDKIEGVQAAVQYVSERVDTVEGKLAAIRSFDYSGRFIVAQADVDMVASGNSQIQVSIDNVNHAAYLRFGSAEVVDTIDAVWFISKTGNKIANDFGDVLHPNAQRRDVQLFLQATSDKQGDEPLEGMAPPHTHNDYALKDHSHDPQDLTHDHDDYFPKGSAADDDGNPLPLPYGDAMELGGAVDDVKEENGEQNDRLDDLEAAPTVAIGDNPPSDEKSKDGDLWWDSVRMEMFIRYQDAWITTNALSARVEAGEQVQAELLARVAVGEEQQVILQNKVRALEGAVGEHPFAFLASNAPRPGQFVMINRSGQPTATVADVLYLMFPSTDDNGDNVDMGTLSEGGLLRLSSPDGGIVEFKSGADANSDSFLVSEVVRADFDSFNDGVVYGATYLSQFDPSGLATIVYVDTVTGTLKQETKDYVDDEIGKIKTPSLSVAQHAINCQPPGVEFRYQDGSSGLSAHNFQLWESGSDKRIRISSKGYHVDWLDSGITQDYSMNNGPYFSIYFQPSIASANDRVKWRQRWHGRISRIDWHENDILLHVSSWYSNGSLSPGSVYFITIGGIL